MDISSLQAFLAVAETGSFSRAADRLFITQPAVSKRIAALEDELHTKLFDRIGRRVALTEAGQALLPRARRLLAAAGLHHAFDVGEGMLGQGDAPGWLARGLPVRPAARRSPPP